jgi:hypothetical protein
MFHEHPEYTSRLPVMETYRDLYEGGEQFKKNAFLYLSRRQKEPQQVYGERLERAYYENYVGSIIDWYAATLFRREPQIQVEGESASGRRFFLNFLDDCDLQGLNLTEFFRRQVVDGLVFGSGYTLVDFPRATGTARTRADEEAAGSRRGYLQRVCPLDLVDWSRDEHGRLEWVVLRRKSLRRAGPRSAKSVAETIWTCYDRESFQVFRSIAERGKDTEPEKVDEGFHGFASLKQVPLFELRFRDGLWMMRKAAQLQLEHFNKSNALSWALTMGLFAMPVIYSDREFKQMIGESYYIQLGPEDKFGWTEPEGHVYQLASENLTRLQKEIYRVCYLSGQGGSAFGAEAAQSGLSKQRDFHFTEEVLRAMGDQVKDVMKNVLRGIETVRGDGLKLDVTGLDEFDLADFSNELDSGERLLGMNISSTTLRKQIQKKLALKYLADVRVEVKDRISREIEEAEGNG